MLSTFCDYYLLTTSYELPVLGPKVPGAGCYFFQYNVTNCRLEHVVWSGCLLWGRKFQFPCVLRAVSNRMAFVLGKELPPVIKVIGRIEPRNVWEYVRSLRDSWSKQVIVLMIDPPRGKFFNFNQRFPILVKENNFLSINMTNCRVPFCRT